MITAAQLVVKVLADTQHAEEGLQSVHTKFGQMASSAGYVALAGGVVGAALVGIGVKAVTMAGDFQQSMTQLVTGAGESQSNLKMVSDAILKMSVDTGTSTDQLAQGMYMIESAGYHGAAGLDVLKAAAEGAKVGGADLATVANGVTTAMTDYASSHLTAAQATNELIATVASGKTHMEDLSAALAMILPTASAAGISFSDVNGALATMTAEGVPAADAATYLRQTIIALQAPSKGTKDALASIGLNATQVADDMKKSLPDALKEITDHLAKKFPVGSAQYVAALKDIAGGSKQMQGLLDLTGSHLQTFSDNVKNISGAAKTGGSGIKGFAETQKDFNFQLDKAKAAVSAMMIGLGEQLLPVATQVASFVSGTLIPTIQKFVGWLNGGSAGANAAKVVLIGLGIAIAGALVAAFVAWAIAAGAAAIATIAATWPILAIGAGIALLIAGIVLLVTHWKVVTDFLGGVWKHVTDGVKAGLDWLGGAFNGLGTIVHTIGTGIGAAFKAGFNMLIGDINGFIRMLDSIQIHIPSVGVGPLHTPAFDWGGLGIGQIPYLAEGGIVDRGGEAVVGERGPERVKLPRGAAVLPLPAGMAASAGAGGGAPIVINITTTLDGQVVARNTAKHLPTIIRNATGRREF